MVVRCETHAGVGPFALARTKWLLNIHTKWLAMTQWFSGGFLSSHREKKSIPLDGFILILVCGGFLLVDDLCQRVTLIRFLSTENGEPWMVFLSREFLSYARNYQPGRTTSAGMTRKEWNVWIRCALSNFREAIDHDFWSVCQRVSLMKMSQKELAVDGRIPQGVKFSCQTGSFFGSC